MKYSVAVLSAAVFTAAAFAAVGPANAVPTYCSTAGGTLAGLVSKTSSDCTELRNLPARVPPSTDLNQDYIDFFSGSLGGGWTDVAYRLLDADGDASNSFDQYSWELGRVSTTSVPLTLTEINPPATSKLYDFLFVITASNTDNGASVATSAGLFLDDVEIESGGVYRINFLADFATPGDLLAVALFARLNDAEPPVRVPEPSSLALVASSSLGIWLAGFASARLRSKARFGRSEEE